MTADDQALTPEDQAIVKQIARKMYGSWWAGALSDPDAAYDHPNNGDAREECERAARAVLPVVKTAQRDALTAFIAACEEKRARPPFLMPANYFEDIDAAIRVAQSYVKNYPEETTP